LFDRPPSPRASFGVFYWNPRTRHQPGLLAGGKPHPSRGGDPNHPPAIWALRRFPPFTVAAHGFGAWAENKHAPRPPKIPGSVFGLFGRFFAPISRQKKNHPVRPPRRKKKPPGEQRPSFFRGEGVAGFDFARPLGSRRPPTCGRPDFFCPSTPTTHNRGGGPHRYQGARRVRPPGAHPCNKNGGPAPSPRNPPHNLFEGGGKGGGLPGGPSRRAHPPHRPRPTSFRASGPLQGPTNFFFSDIGAKGPFGGGFNPRLCTGGGPVAPLFVGGPEGVLAGFPGACVRGGYGR